MPLAVEGTKKKGKVSISYSDSGISRTPQMIGAMNFFLLIKWMIIIGIVRYSQLDVSPVIFFIVYEPRCESVANLSTIASNSA